MDAFFNILQTIGHLKYKYYANKPFTPVLAFTPILVKKDDKNDNDKNDNDKQESIYKQHIHLLMSLMIYYEKKYSNFIYSKFGSLYMFLQNSIFTNELKENVFDIFSKAQKCYFAFNRLAYIYKLKKHPYVVTNDLMMNPLDKKHKLTFVLVEEKNNFLFNIHEIIAIIENAIGNSPHFFSDPLMPLNPYNKQPFTLATLYNVYFQMKNIGRVIPTLFHHFFIENFNKVTFSEQYDAMIREYSIKKYIFNSPPIVLYSSVMFMLNNNKYTKRLEIHDCFPKDILVDIFRPFLFMDYMSNYYITGDIKVYIAKHMLDNKLKDFYKFNKHFGKQMIQIIKKNNQFVRQLCINSKHISFYGIPIHSYIVDNKQVFDNKNNHAIENPFFEINDYMEEDNDSIS
jgi:hypothetical protein